MKIISHPARPELTRGNKKSEMNFVFFILLSMISAIHSLRHGRWSAKTMELYYDFRAHELHRLKKYKVHKPVKRSSSELKIIVELASRVELELKNAELNMTLRSTTGEENHAHKSKHCKHFYWKAYRPCM